MADNAQIPPYTAVSPEAPPEAPAPEAPAPVGIPKLTWSPEEVKAFSFGTDLSGDVVGRTPSETIGSLLSTTLDILSANPYYEKGLKEQELYNLESPYLLSIFPEADPSTVQGYEWRRNWINSDAEDKQRELLLRLTNLREAELDDYLKAAFKGYATGMTASEAALSGGRTAFNLAPMYQPGPWSLYPKTVALGYLSKPVYGTLGGIVSALGVGFATDQALEYVFPEERGDLVPGEAAALEGVRTTAGMVGGLSAVPGFSPEARGPALLLERLRRAAPGAGTRGLRFSAAIDRMLPNAYAFAAERPGTFTAAEALRAGVTGYTVSAFGLDDDPVTRTFVELGAGFVPAYTTVRVANEVASRGPGGVGKAYGVWSDYVSPLNLFTAGGRNKLIENYKALWNRGKARVQQGPGREVDTEFLESEKGREAVQQLLNLFFANGENPAEVASRIEAGQDPLANLPEDVLRTIRALGPRSGVDLDEGEIALTALPRGVISQSPTLLSLEAFFKSTKDAKGKDEAFQRAQEFQAALIKVFSLSGSPEGVETARELQQGRYTNFFTEKFAEVADRVVSSVMQVGTPYSGRLSADQQAQLALTLEQRLYDALQTQFRYADNIAQKLYEDAAPEVPAIRGFLDAEGEALDVPTFIDRWDALLAGKNPEQLETLRANPGFREIEKAIDRYRGVLALPGGAADNPAQLRLDTRLGKEAENSRALKLFNDIVAGNVTAPEARPSAFSQKLSESVSRVQERYSDLSSRFGVTDDASPDNLARLERVIDEARKDSKFKTKRERGYDAEVARLADMRRKELIAAQQGEQVSLELPELRRNAAGELYPTEENVQALQTLIDDFMPTQGSSKAVRDATELLRLQKEALQASLAGETIEDIEVRDLINFRKSLLKYKEEHREKGDDFYGIFSQTQKALDDDLQNTIDESLSARWSVARRFYAGYKDALAISFVGGPSAEKAFGRAKVSPEELVRGLLAGTDKDVAARYNDLWETSQFFRDQAARNLPAETSLADVGAEGETVLSAVSRATEDVRGWSMEVLGRDVVLPLEEATRRAQAAGESVPDAQLAALNRIKARFGEEGFQRLSTLLGEDFSTLLRNAEDAGDFLVRARKLLDAAEKKQKSSYALSRAINTENPYEVVTTALNKNTPVSALDSLVTTVRQVGRRQRAAREGGQMSRSARAMTERMAEKEISFSEKEALDGLKGNIFDAIFQKAGGEDNFNPQRAYQLLFSTGARGAMPKENQTSVADWMISRNLVTQQELDGYEKLLDTFSQIQAGVLSGQLNPEEINMQSSIFSLMAVKMLGAKLGAAAGKAVPFGGSTLQAPQFGSQLAQNFYETMPALQRFDMLRRIVNDRELLLLALKTPKDSTERDGIFKAFLNRMDEVAGKGWEETEKYLGRRISFGVTSPVRLGPRIQAPYGGEEEESSQSRGRPVRGGPLPVFKESPLPGTNPPGRGDMVPPYRPASPVTPPAAPGPDQRSMAVPAPAPTRVAEAPAPALGPRIPAGPQRPTPQTSGPVDRGRFLSLFPSGPAADLARTQQGIGSLMQGAR